MKKNNTSVDIVAFGDLSDENLEKLRAFNEAVKGGDGSHLEIVHPGPNLLSDSIVASPILAGEGGTGAAAAAQGGAGGEGGQGGGGDFEFGVDPSMDPELALALRMSFEEERNRQEKDKRDEEAKEGKTSLEAVPEGEEVDASKPLLDSNGEPSGSASQTVGQETEVKRPEDKKKDDEDRMDTE